MLIIFKICRVIPTPSPDNEEINPQLMLSLRLKTIYN